MQKNSSYNHYSTKVPPSPRLLRSKSENPDMSQPKIRPNTSNTTSKQVPCSKTLEDKLSYNKCPNREKKYGANNTEKIGRKIRSAPTSPSAWALSPGRARLPDFQLVPKLSNNNSGKTKIETSRTNGNGGVWRFFRQKKKVSREQEEDIHQFRVMQNRLLQWRFVNARAEKSNGAEKRVAETKLFNVWVRIYVLRNSILEKRSELQKLRKEIKLYQIIFPQMCLLKEWYSKLESKNTEAIGRMTTKLREMSMRLPLVQGAKGDASSLYEAMHTALRTMDDIKAVGTKFLPRVEKTCFLVTELSLLQSQQDECINELQSWVSIIVSLQAEERCLRAHLLQTVKDPMEV